jgi:hypothetical protein
MSLANVVRGGEMKEWKERVHVSGARHWPLARVKKEPVKREVERVGEGRGDARARTW